jgi:hypothetical protein
VRKKWRAGGSVEEFIEQKGRREWLGRGGDKGGQSDITGKTDQGKAIQELVRVEAFRYPRPPKIGGIEMPREVTHARVMNLLNTVVVGTGNGSLTSECATQVEARVHGNHLSQNLQALLRNSLVID